MEISGVVNVKERLRDRDQCFSDLNGMLFACGPRLNGGFWFSGSLGIPDILSFLGTP